MEEVIGQENGTGVLTISWYSADRPRILGEYTKLAGETV